MSLQLLSSLATMPPWILYATGQDMGSFLHYFDPRRSLAAAVGWLVVALAVCFATVATIWIGGMARADILQQHVQQFTLETEVLASDMNLALASRLRAVQTVAAILMSDMGHDAPRALRTVFDELQSTYPEFEWIGLADATGKVVAANAGLREGSDVAEHPWFLQGLKGPWIGNVKSAESPNDKPQPIQKGEPRRFADMAAPVRDAKGRVAGVVAAHLSWRWAHAYAQRLSETLDPQNSAHALVLDREGVVLVGPDTFQGKRWNGVAVNDNSLADSTSVTLKDGALELVSAFERLPDGQEVLVGRARDANNELKALGCCVQLVEPAARAYRRANALWMHILSVSLGTGGFIALLGVLVARRLTRRLTHLTRSVEAVGRDDTSHIEVPNGSDEVVRLGVVFADVLGALQLERGKLRAFSAGLEQRVASRTREVVRLAEEARYATVVRERLKIARDLHDTLAHSMMAMLAEVRLLRKLHVHDPGALSDELAHAEQVAHQGLKEARAAITQMRFNAVRDVGLGAALADAIKLFSERTGLAVDFISEPRAASFAEERAETLFRIAEEALRNVERHAMASRVRVGLRVVGEGCLELGIEDDGAGFDPTTPHSGHYGLVGIREQAQLIGAELTIKSAPDEGTSLRLALRIEPDLRS